MWHNKSNWNWKHNTWMQNRKRHISANGITFWVNRLVRPLSKFESFPELTYMPTVDTAQNVGIDYILGHTHTYTLNRFNFGVGWMNHYGNWTNSFAVNYTFNITQIQFFDQHPWLSGSMEQRKCTGISGIEAISQPASHQTYDASLSLAAVT